MLKRNINFLNKDFSSFRDNLINYSKTYFPTTYNDFDPSSVGMMFIEMASYVGDVLGFYIDTQVQESFIQYAKQQDSLFNLAYMLGYKVRATVPSVAPVEFYQIVPSKISGSEYVPDFNYSLIINSNSVLSSNIGSSFLVEDVIDFSYSSSLDPTQVTVLSYSGGNPSFFQLKKTRNAISATINTTTVTVTEPQEFYTINIEGSNIVGILDIIDSDGNKWYEVPYLAQEVVFDSIKNTNINDPNIGGTSDVPYLLKVKKVQRRFATKPLNPTTLQLQFGSGTTSDNDEVIIPNPNNVGIGLPSKINKLTTAYSPFNFLFTNTYGIAPSNTTLTIRYLTGGGVASNVPAESINSIVSANIKFKVSNLNSTTAQSVFNSVAVINPAAASGGRSGDTIEEIRLNSLNNFQSQLRTVTQDDYLIRILSLPPQYGTVSKIFIEPSKISNLTIGQNPSFLDVYILTYDQNKNLKIANNVLKQNIITYISQQYRSLGDLLVVKDAFIINIGVDFEIIVLPNYNTNEVLINCINALKSYFNIDNWQINQPILLRDIYILLDKIEGVQTVKTVTINNKSNTNLGYSKYSYDISGATINNVIYPSLDPSIFELKYPNIDITGRTSNL